MDKLLSAFIWKDDGLQIKARRYLPIDHGLQPPAGQPIYHPISAAIIVNRQPLQATATIPCCYLRAPPTATCRCSFSHLFFHPNVVAVTKCYWHPPHNHLVVLLETRLDTPEQTQGNKSNMGTRTAQE